MTSKENHRTIKFPFAGFFKTERYLATPTPQEDSSIFYKNLLLKHSPICLFDND